MMSANREIFDAERQVLSRLADALLRDEQLAAEIFGASVSEVELLDEPGPLALRVLVGDVAWHVGVDRFPSTTLKA
jgi:hypothetical protein